VNILVDEPFEIIVNSFLLPGNQPGARDGHTACVLGDNMYIFGGFEEVIDQFSCDVHCLNLKTMHWKYVQTFGEIPSYRDFHSATIINNRMYIFGGRGDIFGPYHSQEEIYCPKIVYLDLKTHYWHMPTTVGKVPVGRRSHSACKW
jgi:N-acetylneuraminic acid mutarotase